MLLLLFLIFSGPRITNTADNYGLFLGTGETKTPEYTVVTCLRMMSEGEALVGLNIYTPVNLNKVQVFIICPRHLHIIYGAGTHCWLYLETECAVLIRLKCCDRF